MILIKGEIKTSQIKFCKNDKQARRVNVTFTNGQTFPYSYNNVEWLKEPQVLDPNMFQISRNGCQFNNIEAIYVFRNGYLEYWHICFEGGKEGDYKRSELNIQKSCLTQRQASNVFEYLKEIASLSDLKNKKSGEKILAKRFEKIPFVGFNVALSKYLYPVQNIPLNQNYGNKQEYFPIFPFGCNNSQYSAVKNAMENQISVIQGPPGTGKTQTILNIIANILMQGKTVQVVSNNNSATENVYEKLASPKYNLGFVIATLGCTDNKKDFIEQQDECYPDFSSWYLQDDPNILYQNIIDMSSLQKIVFDKKERLANLRQEQSQLITEFEYFSRYVQESDVSTNSLKVKKRLSSNQWLELWQECQTITEMDKKIGLLFKIKGFLNYGIKDLGFYKQDIAKIITTFQYKFYQTKREELNKEISEIEEFLQFNDNDLLQNTCEQSMAILKDNLARRYGIKSKRTKFEEDDLWKNPVNVLEEYPVILSTTFSSRNSLNTDVVYDYLIMDEASQVDIATGALALSCARNVVIVGDTKQLPNVITKDVEARANAMFERFNVNEGYRFTKSFLQSVLEVVPDVAQTLLREHYRCHPKIINFCNQKFYRGELVIMTEDHGEEDVLAVVKTTQGNHARDHYSQRQIDVIKNEVIPKYVTNPKETGIISPYKNQVMNLNKEITDIEAATVHKFQGKEKDTIIISTVDDEISDFADDPYLINVAVSRAKKKLILVVTGNDQTRESNISDLISYIQYNNFEVTDSKTYSVFDYLYKQYTESRNLYFQKHKKISEYDSENLMYSLIEEVLSMDKYAILTVVCHFPMNMLIKDPKLLNEKEIKYAMNPATHIDFLITNRISKKPVLAIEVDGYKFHKANTKQSERDLLKNHILQLYEIPLLRLNTNGSGEKEQIARMLESLEL